MIDTGSIPPRAPRKNLPGKGTVLLVNPNPMKPTIAPIGLDYVGRGLIDAGYAVRLADASLDGPQAVSDALDDHQVEPYAAVGISLRNIDSALLVDGDPNTCGSGNLDYLRSMIRRIVDKVDIPVVLGGVGFSAVPEGCLAETGAGWGIVGEGEKAFPLLLDALAGEGDLESVPNLIHAEDHGGFCRHEINHLDLASEPVPARETADNESYMISGGQLGLETKRGCNGACSYCIEAGRADGVIRTRSPQSILAEVETLLGRRLNVFHICDSEFNRPADHAKAVCRSLAESGLGERIRWYAYLSPKPFDAELAGLMAAAGCVGIDFGADHTDSKILRALRRDHRRQDVLAAIDLARSAGITVMIDLLLGGPGETPETLRRVVADLKASTADVIGTSMGIRIYPATAMGQALQRGEYQGDLGLKGVAEGNPHLIEPVFYLSDDLGPEPLKLMNELVAGDRRFLFAGGSDETKDYNYESNDLLVGAIKDGHKGAYWDILRRLAFNLGPLEVPS